MESTARKLSVKMSVVVPRVPNFLFTSDGKVPLSALTEDGLRELGAAWTEALVARADEQRSAQQYPVGAVVPGSGVSNQ
jgi:hypothetical protein